MTVLREVVAWSSGIPDWQRDALRRIVRQRSLTPDDLSELVERCKRPHGLSRIDVVAEALGAADVPAQDERGVVALSAVKHVGNVNALEPGQQLRFSSPGLTIVYGDNGAGKSSYARVLKRACRARGAGDPVLPNALSEEPGGQPTAEISFTADGQTRTHLWRDGEGSSPELAAVSVFDSSSAQVYVSDKTEVAFRPFGLDVLDRLAAACTDVRSRLEKERDALALQGPVWPAFPPASPASQFLASLSALTTAEDVDRATNMTPADSEELQRLNVLLALSKGDDPLKRAARARHLATRLAGLGEHLRAVESALGRDSVERLGRLRRDLTEAESAAELSRRAFESDSKLPGVGSQPWRRLWDAAKAYSQAHAYPEQRFPHTTAGARCVLCQQELQEDACTRLDTFEAFVQGRVQRQAREAADALTRAVEELRQVDIDSEAHTVEGLVETSPAVGASVALFLKQAAEHRAALLVALAAPNGELAALAMPAQVDALSAVEAALRTEANDLERAADPAALRAAEARVSELEARARIGELKPTILGEVTRLARLNAYDGAIRDTATNVITRCSTELTKRYVTDALSAAFDAELKKFGFTQPELVLRPVGGQRGALYHQVQLKHATRAQLHRIMSEGEARCLALAAFLAEVHSGGTPSAIVFDDPVSSLDHRWRSRMADRLVAEARGRQVIVFTHELVFLYELTQAAQKAGVPHSCQTIARIRNVPGRIDADLPWSARSASKRLGPIRDALQRARRTLKETGPEAYEIAATAIYGRLRRTWERAVEEVLLNGVVERFRDSVHTQKLKRVFDVTEADYRAVDAGMSKCSKWEGGHDHALAMNEPVPLPDEIEQDIDALEQFIVGVTQRRA